MSNQITGNQRTVGWSIFVLSQPVPVNPLVAGKREKKFPSAVRKMRNTAIPRNISQDTHPRWPAFGAIPAADPAETPAAREVGLGHEEAFGGG